MASPYIQAVAISNDLFTDALEKRGSVAAFEDAVRALEGHAINCVQPAALALILHAVVSEYSGEEYEENRKVALRALDAVSDFVGGENSTESALERMHEPDRERTLSEARRLLDELRQGGRMSNADLYDASSLLARAESAEGDSQDIYLDAALAILDGR